MLSDKEILSLYSVTKGCYEIKNLTEFRQFVRTRIREVFPHEVAACYIANAPHRRLLRLINIDFPGKYFREYFSDVIRHDRGIYGPIAKWLHHQTPLFIRLDGVNEAMDPAWVQLARRLNIRTAASHGLVDVGGTFFTYFSFGGIHPSVHDKATEYLKILIPHLHVTLLRQLRSSEPTRDSSGLLGISNVEEIKSSCDQCGLTRRERQILAWLCMGKTNWEISRIFDISENTVKNHVQNICKKFGVTNRTQAAGKAVSCSCIRETEVNHARFHDQPASLVGLPAL